MSSPCTYFFWMLWQYPFLQYHALHKEIELLLTCYGVTNEDKRRQTKTNEELPAEEDENSEEDELATVFVLN
jgi:hypothetical protein